ncbi:MAG: FecR domain-containing protein [Arcobacteraceae bacterium]
MKNIEEQAISWLIKEKEGLNVFEEKELKDWLEKSSFHQEAYTSNKQIRESFLKFSDTLKEQLVQGANQGAKKTRLIQYSRKIAMAAMFLLCIGFGSYHYYEFTTPIYSKSFISINQVQNNLILPDNSKIVMDVHSNMNIYFYKNSREVNFLEGRAVFYVAKDKEKPFIIKTKNAKIEVVGTAFEVSNIKEKLSVKVKEGVVKVFLDKKTVLLKQGEQIISNETDIVNLGETELETIASWEKGFLTFNKTSLKDTLDEFSRYMDIQAEYQSEDVQNTAITGKFSINDFDKFLAALPKIYAIKVENKQEILKFSKN